MGQNTFQDLAWTLGKLHILVPPATSTTCPAPGAPQPAAATEDNQGCSGLQTNCAGQQRPGLLPTPCASVAMRAAPWTCGMPLHTHLGVQIVDVGTPQPHHLMFQAGHLCGHIHRGQPLLDHFCSGPRTASYRPPISKDFTNVNSFNKKTFAAKPFDLGHHTHTPLCLARIAQQSPSALKGRSQAPRCSLLLPFALRPLLLAQCVVLPGRWLLQSQPPWM